MVLYVEHDLHKFAERSIERFLVAGIASDESAVESLLKLLLALLTHLHCSEESEFLIEDSLHFLPSDLLATLLQVEAIPLEQLERSALVVEYTEVNLLWTLVHAECHSACVVVGSDHDKRLIGVLLIEVVGKLNRLVEV